MPLRSLSSSRTVATRLAVRAVAIALMASPLAACGFWDDDPGYKTQATDPPDLLYNQGLVAMKAGEYSKASKRFESLDKQYPQTEWQKKAILMMAYSNYTSGNYDDAITSSRRYVTLWPTDKDAAYMTYIWANSQYKQIPDITRDQDRASQALAGFQKVVTDYPKSEYVSDSKFKIQVVRDQLAGKEMEIGRFYQKQQNYAAAVNRYKTVVKDYAQTRQIEEALSRLTECYMALGLSSEAQTAAAILGHNYPNSQWYKDAYSLVKSHGLEPREDTDSWLSRTFRSAITL
ncbi:outer membrane protein assembly factor BamD [Labrys sp. KNU-23]|uniref:outer membrane protein assembly factor BamD n=1 Tax=Labrys sp. KNU-23 TaxID=2789216 RepID=UPI0011EDE702|nr:outer membrane protein assembly factor BamD [Labrys sp. KNU-23]QEN87181.1 outer membrane protein assembly factor BamD [Labrys sp. KNU-23]